MKKLFLLAAFTALFSVAEAQGFKGLVKKVMKDSSVGAIVSPHQTGGLDKDEIIAGLKEALSVGTTEGTNKLSAPDGFFRDAAVKILMPEEARKVEQKLRSLGLGKQVDNAILSMNRAAEDAAKSAAPIFLNAIRGITIGDGLGILKGGDFAATNYLRGKTQAQLSEAFRPLIESSLQKVNATNYWNTVFATYNRFSKETVDTDLAAFVTAKALDGIFYQVGVEEKQIRENPLARTSGLLKKVFGN